MFIIIFFFTTFFITFFLITVHALFADNQEGIIRKLFERKLSADTVNIEKVGVGLTNRNFCVQAHDENFFVRMGTMHASKLYICRQLEEQFYMMGQELDLTPKLLYCDPAQGILITPFIDHVSNYGKIKGIWTGEPREVIARSIQALKRIHSYRGAPFKATPYPYRVMDYYYKVGLQIGAHFPENLKATIALAKNLGVSFDPIVLCHHDFYSGNLLFDGNKLYVIDWEYADWDDPLFDLAGYCTEQHFDDAEIDLALQEYLPNFQAKDRIKLDKMCMLYALKTAMWSWIQMELEPDIQSDIEPIATGHMDTFWRLASKYQLSIASTIQEPQEALSNQSYR